MTFKIRSILELTADHKQIIEAYLYYQAQYRSIKPLTIDKYSDWLHNYCAWLERHDLNFLNVETNDLRCYAKYLCENYRSGPSKGAFAGVKAAYDWASLESVGLLKKNPFPKELSIAVAYDIIRLIPTATEIFNIRSHIANLDTAIALEILICTGLRRNEIVQVRWSDLEWGVIPYDSALKRSSPFVEAKCDMDKTRFNIKGSRRTVYFSVIACKLLRWKMELIGVDKDSPLPILPMNDRSIYDMINQFDQLISKDGHPTADDLLKTGHNKQLYELRQRLEDVSDDELKDLPTDTEAAKKTKAYLRKKKARFAAKEKLILPENPYKSSKPPKEGRLNVHSLRRFFGCAMYFRNWYGNRRDRHEVSLLMGHANMKTTNIYMYKNSGSVKSNAEWTRLWRGNGTEYLKLRYS